MVAGMCVFSALLCTHSHAPAFCVIFSKLYYSFSAPSLTLLFFVFFPLAILMLQFHALATLSTPVAVGKTL